MAEQGLGGWRWCGGGELIELNVKTACMILCFVYKFTGDAYSALQPLIKTATKFPDRFFFNILGMNLSVNVEMSLSLSLRGAQWA